MKKVENWGRRRNEEGEMGHQLTVRQEAGGRSLSFFSHTIVSMDSNLHLTSFYFELRQLAMSTCPSFDRINPSCSDLGWHIAK